MDDKILEMLVNLMEGQTEIKSDIKGINTRLDGIDNRLDKIDNRIDGIDNRLDKIDNRIDKIDTRLVEMDARIDKIELSQEVIINKLDIITEIQTAHKEQNQRAIENSDELTKGNIGLLGTAIKSVSIDVKDVKESVEVMKDVLGHHQIDIEILKRRPV